MEPPNPQHANNSEPSLPVSNLLPTSTGHIVSTKGLLERILEQFRAEFSDEQVMAASPVEQRTMVRDVAQYVMRVENVVLSMSEQAQLIQRAASELLGYGGIDPLLQDEAVTTVLIDGLEGVGIRRGPGADLETLPTVFDDHAHLQRVVDRLLLAAKVAPNVQVPIIETGLMLYGRRASLNVALPPFVAQVRVDIRLHGRTPPTLEAWRARGIVTERAVALLEALVASPHGIMIVGDTESGKTTLLNMLGLRLDEPPVVVERAPEMSFDSAVPRLAIRYERPDSVSSLAELVRQALDMKPTVLLLDEVRADEPEAIAPLLLEAAPRQLWTFRGTAEVKRIKAALTILVQRGAAGQAEEALRALFDRLPFVVLLRRRRGGLQLVEVAEWQQPAEEVTLVPLLRWQEGTHQPTGQRPQRGLALASSFWDA